MSPRNALPSIQYITVIFEADIKRKNCQNTNLYKV